MTLRETYARDICQNPGVPLEDCPRRAEHYALVDERLAGLEGELANALLLWEVTGYVQTWVRYDGDSEECAAAIVAALEDRT